MKPIPLLYLENRAQWRKWLKANHATVPEIWLVYYKIHTGKPFVPYDDSVEEAICFGWIDSTLRSIDSEKYARKFTPRTNSGNWSEINIKRAEKMIREGKMTPSGRAVYSDPAAARSRRKKGPDLEALELTPDIRKKLMAHKEAWRNFMNLAPSHQKRYIIWLATARKEETRARRIKEVINLLTQKKPLGLK